MGSVMVGEEGIEVDEPCSEVGFLGAGQEPEVTCFIIDKCAEISVLSQ